jgi:hypothetical protein
VAVTPANVSESRYFEQATEGVETSRYYADKGSASAENRAILKKKELGAELSTPLAETNPSDTGKRSSTGWFPRSDSRSNKPSVP